MKCQQCKADSIGTELIGGIQINTCAEGHRTGVMPLTAEMRAWDAGKTVKKPRGRKRTATQITHAEMESINNLFELPADAANDR